jgi:hypothetical protein
MRGLNSGGFPGDEPGDVVDGAEISDVHVLVLDDDVELGFDIMQQFHDVQGVDEAQLKNVVGVGEFDLVIEHGEVPGDEFPDLVFEFHIEKY